MGSWRLASPKIIFSELSLKDMRFFPTSKLFSSVTLSISSPKMAYLHIRQVFLVCWAVSTAFSSVLNVISINYY